jgi:NAD-dependent SIR2 family protein deacetylase
MIKNKHKANYYEQECENCDETFRYNEIYISNRILKKSDLKLIKCPKCGVHITPCSLCYEFDGGCNLTMPCRYAGFIDRS